MTKEEYLEDQCEKLTAVCMELAEAVDGLTTRMAHMANHINELTEAVNINTEWRDEMEKEAEALAEELEVVFEPALDAFRDKSRDN